MVTRPVSEIVQLPLLMFNLFAYIVLAVVISPAVVVEPRVFMSPEELMVSLLVPSDCLFTLIDVPTFKTEFVVIGKEDVEKPSVEFLIDAFGPKYIFGPVIILSDNGKMLAEFN
jgi:hypothetical protein